MARQKLTWRKRLQRVLMSYLAIFAGEEHFINSHRGKSSMIKEQNRYGKVKK
ncbi:hypothetical protein [uncultured Limosilactobacillus sp.]|uniref:hypothetical protein n=1 Tax=uncultured Limosilactobacillus sp. TaxID=2837629 RepID=UPI0025FEFA58|nr:hypothetical protein [uncultured Limosilactobacillus sp.]